VPLSRIAEFLVATDAAIRTALPSARSFAFGHVGDRQSALRHKGAGQRRRPLGRAGRARVDRVRSDREAERLDLRRQAGLGLAKNAAIARYKNAAELDLMRALKRTLDPNNILTPASFYRRRA